MDKIYEISNGRYIDLSMIISIGIIYPNFTSNDLRRNKDSYISLSFEVECQFMNGFLTITHAKNSDDIKLCKHDLITAWKKYNEN